ncbi:transporter substrate-binding domain-containing protein [Occultella kanbiaonis]|uniref:transporter substrate-binding domain-containing protein n=1 Tax=Occultella kanbiaonis TaxID=2675754 RepID=UPI0012B940C5|nr:transporter substrate-binding domain-containing protein [Occultella kanbiaonis]
MNRRTTRTPWPGRLASIVALAATTALLAACGGSGGEDETDGEAAGLELVTEGTLTVCSDIPYPPFEVEDASAESGYSGFDMDIMQEIADRLELTLSVQDVSFDALQSGAVLGAGQCDLGASAMTITPERAENLDFSDPYYDSLQSLLVPAASGVTSLATFTGALGVQQGTTGQAFAEENAPDGVQLVEFPSDGELWPALQGDTIQGILQDLPVNVEHVRTDSSYVVVEEFQTDESYGFAFAKGERPNLLAAVNEHLQAMRDDGTYETIYDRYFSTEG